MFFFCVKNSLLPPTPQLAHSSAFLKTSTESATLSVVSTPAGRLALTLYPLAVKSVMALSPTGVYRSVLLMMADDTGFTGTLSTHPPARYTFVLKRSSYRLHKSGASYTSSP
jgi:hypothetical protein